MRSDGSKVDVLVQGDEFEELLLAGLVADEQRDRVPGSHVLQLTKP
jgi:hypothetical protein